MNEDHESDLGALWRAETPVDVAAITERLRRLNRLHRTLNRVALVIGMAATLTIAWAEQSGAFGTGGALSAGLGALLIGAIAHHRWARKRLAMQWSTEPRALLAFAAGRARAGRWLARTLYAGVPLGLVTGYACGFALARISERPVGLPPYWAVAPALLLVILAAVAGLRMARQRTREIRKLEAQLRQLDDAV